MARRVSSAALLVLAIAVLLLPANPLNAQTDGADSSVPEAGFSPPQPAAPPASDGMALPGGKAPASTIHVYSRETIVDVLVTDKQGQPVHGLTRSDFTILEGGQPRSIRGFSESSASPPAPAPELPPNTYSNAHSMPANGPVQIFLIERAVVQLATQPGIVVPPGLIDYLRTMAPGTHVAIFTFSPVTGLQMIQNFTSDGSAAAAAAGRILPDVDLAPAYRGPTTQILHIAAMQQIAAFAAGIRGRKNLIWVTPGMPLMVDRDGGYEWGGTHPPDMSIVHRLMDAYETFSREQIAIYPLDPNGIHPEGLASLKAQEVADQSGGTYGNTNDIQGEIAGIVDRSSDTYTLSFVPSRPNEDARFHTIKILVDRSDLTLTYRTGYDDDHPRPPDGMLKADLLPAPMRIGALPATQLLFTMTVTPATAEERRAAAAAPPHITDKSHLGSPRDPLYEVAFHFDPTQIIFSENPDGKRTAKLEFDLGVFNNSSQLGPVRSQSITLTVNPSGYDAFMHRPCEFKLAIPMPAGERILRAGLFDTVSGKAGTIQVPLTIPRQ